MAHSSPRYSLCAYRYVSSSHSDDDDSVSQGRRQGQGSLSLPVSQSYESIAETLAELEIPSPFIGSDPQMIGWMSAPNIHARGVRDDQSSQYTASTRDQGFSLDSTRDSWASSTHRYGNDCLALDSRPQSPLLPEPARLSYPRKISAGPAPQTVSLRGSPVEDDNSSVHLQRSISRRHRVTSPTQLEQYSSELQGHLSRQSQSSEFSVNSYDRRPTTPSSSVVPSLSRSATTFAASPTSMTFYRSAQDTMDSKIPRKPKPRPSAPRSKYSLMPTISAPSPSPQFFNPWSSVPISRSTPPSPLDAPPRPYRHAPYPTITPENPEVSVFYDSDEEEGNARWRAIKKTVSIPSLGGSRSRNNSNSNSRPSLSHLMSSSSKRSSKDVTFIASTNAANTAAKRSSKNSRRGGTPEPTMLSHRPEPKRKGRSASYASGTLFNSNNTSPVRSSSLPVTPGGASDEKAAGMKKSLPTLLRKMNSVKSRKERRGSRVAGWNISAPTTPTTMEMNLEKVDPVMELTTQEKREKEKAEKKQEKDKKESEKREKNQQQRAKKSRLSCNRTSVTSSLSLKQGKKRVGGRRWRVWFRKIFR